MLQDRDPAELRVALIHFWLVGMRGGEKVLESLCRIFPRADIYTHVVRPESLSDTLLRHTIRTTFIQKLPGSIRHYQKYLPLMPLALEQLDLRGYDLVISSESGPAKGVVVRADCPHVCYCHSPMRYLWDFYQDYLESAGVVTRLFMRPLFHYLRLWDYASAQRVDHILANSSCVAGRVRRWWGREAAVVHPPVAVERFKAADTSLLESLPGSPEPGYYLCLGELVNYKRVDLAVQACARTGRRLVVAGDGAERKKLETVGGSSVLFLGRVPEKVLPALYAGCRGFLFPGEEDFGITPVEAMAAGRPVIAYGRGGVLDSVIEGETGMFFHEQTVESLIDALNRFEQKRFSAEICMARAERFSEDAFRQAFLHEVSRYGVSH